MGMASVSNGGRKLLGRAPVVTPQPPCVGFWREITHDAAAKEVFIRIMERMDQRYVGLGAPSAPFKNPLDQWIDQHSDLAYPRGVALFAWAPESPPVTADQIHLVLGVTFNKLPLSHQQGLRRIAIEMLGINPAIYRRPSLRKIQSLARVFGDKFVDLGTHGLNEKPAPRGKSVVLSGFRPKSMTWQPAFLLHESVCTDPCSVLVRERDCGDRLYWQFKVTKL